MDYRKLGHSGFMVPALTFGTGTFGGKGEFFGAWGTSDVRDATRLIDIALDAGLNMFDSADGYSGGAAEEVLGQAIKGRRDRVLISTKGTFRFGERPNDVGSSRHHLIDAVEGSLRRLGTDYIDLYQLHAFDAATPIEETLQTLTDLVQAGKIRYIGASNFSGWHLMKSLAVSEKYGLARHIAHQAYYSLIGRDYEWELMPLGLDQGVSAVVWSPLGWGRLTGKIRRGQPQSAAIVQGRQHGTASRRRSCLPRGRRTGRDRRGNRPHRPANCPQLAAPAADRGIRHHRRTQRTTTARQPGRGGMGAHAGTSRPARRGKRDTQALSLLAPGALHRAQSVAGLMPAMRELAGGANHPRPRPDRTHRFPDSHR